MTAIRFSSSSYITLAAGALLCSAATFAADPGNERNAQARFRQEMAACNAGTSNQDPATCREEARNALAASRSGALNDVPGQYQKNARQRCEFLQGDDRIDCESRMRGEGIVKGSAASGGILRETVTTTITPGK